MNERTGLDISPSLLPLSRRERGLPIESEAEFR